MLDKAREMILKRNPNSLCHRIKGALTRMISDERAKEILHGFDICALHRAETFAGLSKQKRYPNAERFQARIPPGATFRILAGRRQASFSAKSRRS